MTAEELADRFDISIGAAKIRFEEIERMRRRKSGEKRRLPRSVETYLKDAVRKGHNVLSLENDDGRG